MWDTYGDGWNGIEFLLEDGAGVQEFDLLGGNFVRHHLCLREGPDVAGQVCYSAAIDATEGEYPSEIGWALKDSLGTLLYSACYEEYADLGEEEADFDLCFPTNNIPTVCVFEEEE